MNQIIQFFIHSRDLLLFLLLFGLSISLVLKSNYYSQSVYLHSANVISGKLYGFSNYWAQYFNLRSQNGLLSEENRTLRKELLQLQQQVSSLSHTDSLTFAHADTLRFRVPTVNVTKNSFRLHKNYLTIDKGSNNGMKQDMGVISLQGIVGIVENTSGRFATVQSVLNTKSALNMMIKRIRHFGSLHWDTQSLNRVQPLEVPNITPIQYGDTIVTGGTSNTFPKEIPIGEIAHHQKSQHDNTYIIDVQLFTDMSNLDYVYIIEDTDRTAVKAIEKQDSK